jgi:hypothetical protein
VVSIKRICVYTCITGDYDTLKIPFIREKNVDYICFTNNKNIKSNFWKIIYIKDSKLDDHYLSRKIKMLGHPYISKNYDISIWIDGSVVIKGFISDFLKLCELDKYNIACFKHSVRSCIYEEAEACIYHKKDSKEKILKQMEFYKKQNYPANNGLIEATVLVKKHNNKEVLSVMKCWFDMIQKYSKRDQLSFNYVATIKNFKYKELNLNVFDNKYFTNDLHQKNEAEKPTEYAVFYQNESNQFDEDNSERYDYIVDGDCYIGHFKIKHDTNIIRIDPTDIKGFTCYKIYIDNYQKIKYNNLLRINNRFFFINEDPQIIINGNFKKDDSINLEFVMTKAKDNELIEIIDKLLETSPQNKVRSLITKVLNKFRKK